MMISDFNNDDDDDDGHGDSDNDDEDVLTENVRIELLRKPSLALTRPAGGTR